MVNTQDNLLTAGEFATLARTTKRTVLWYGQAGILKPKQVDSATSYRYYEPQQIIDFQAILLLRRLRFSLPQIKAYLATNHSLAKLFEAQQAQLKHEIAQLQTALTTTDTYYKNLQITGTLVHPKIKVVPAMSIYYLDKYGSYSQIGQYLDDLRACFTRLPITATLLTIFMDVGYRPKKAHMYVGVVAASNIKLKKGTPVKELTLPAFKAVTYTHMSSSKLLSLLWRELSKYCRKNNLVEDNSLGFDDLELYHYVGLNKSPDNHGYLAELLLPIR